MKDLILYLAIIAISSMIFLPLHIVVLRARKGAALITTINLVIGVSTALGLAVGWLLFAGLFSSPGARTLAFVSAALTFASYAGLYGLLGPSSVDRSVSVHVVELVYRAPKHRLAEKGLLQLYPHEDVLRKRFDDCVETGIVERDGTDFVITPKGARIARIYMAIGSLLGMRLWYLDRYWKYGQSGQD